MQTINWKTESNLTVRNSNKERKVTLRYLQMKVNIILLNGPARSGKDTISNMIKEQLDDTHTVFQLKFTNLMDKVAKLILNLNNHDYKEWREDKKDEPLLLFKDTTMRKFLIAMSEDFIKPQLGSGIMGYHAAKQAVELIQNASMYNKDVVLVFSDCGFQKEFNYFKQTVKQSVLPKGTTVDVQLVNVSREGCTFKGDSRETVHDSNSSLIYNCEDIGSLDETVETFLTIKGLL